MCHYGSFWVVSSLNVSVSECTEILRLWIGCDDEAEIMLESFLGRRALIGIVAMLQLSDDNIGTRITMTLKASRRTYRCLG
jgi:hypothetical protein